MQKDALTLGFPTDSPTHSFRFVEMTVVGCILTVFSALLSIAKIYEARLHRQEAAAILRSRFSNSVSFSTNMYWSQGKEMALIHRI